MKGFISFIAIGLVSSVFAAEDNDLEQHYKQRELLLDGYLRMSYDYCLSSRSLFKRDKDQKRRGRRWGASGTSSVAGSYGSSRSSRGGESREGRRPLNVFAPLKGNKGRQLMTKRMLAHFTDWSTLEKSKSRDREVRQKGREDKRGKRGGTRSAPSKRGMFPRLSCLSHNRAEIACKLLKGEKLDRTYKEVETGTGVKRIYTDNKRKSEFDVDKTCEVAEGVKNYHEQLAKVNELIAELEAKLGDDGIVVDRHSSQESNEEMKDPHIQTIRNEFRRRKPSNGIDNGIIIKSRP